tara:strand:+ start:510 stop:1055 length:546 start_codon:yes stop_codon:yes gene_type:complete
MTNEVSFVYFLPDYPSRVVKFYMSEMHKVRGGGIAIGDPDIMAPALPIQQAEKWYEIHTGKKKTFKDVKTGQKTLYNVLMKKAVKMEEEDMSNKYRQVPKIDIPKPNNYCKTVRGRDPYDTSQILTRTDKMPMSQNNKDRLKKYEGKPTIQDVLDKGILNLNDIKYDIKLGYITKTSKVKA